MHPCAMLNDIMYARRFSGRCAENLKLMQDLRKNIHEVVSTGRSLAQRKFFISLQDIRHSQCLGVQRKHLLIKCFLISVVCNSVFTAVLEVQKEKQ